MVFCKSTEWSSATIAACLLAAGPAGAVDLNGRTIVVEAQAQDVKKGASAQRNVEIAGSGNLVQWPTLPTSCTVSGQPTRVAMVYGPDPNRTGKIDCDPQADGAPGSAVVATYRSTYSNAGDTLSLTGRMTVRETARAQKGGASAHTETSDATTDVKQAITVRIAGGRCEVLDFAFEMTTQRKVVTQLVLGRGERKAPETKTSDDHERWTVPDRKRCTVVASPG